MIHRFGRLRRALASILVIPISHFGVALLITLHQQGTLTDAAMRFGVECMVLALWPIGLIKGRFPTSVELATLGGWQIFILIVGLATLWLYLGLFMLGIAAVLRPPIDRHLGRWQKTSLVMSVVIALLIWVFLPRLPSPDYAIIHINLTKTSGQMPPLQRSFSQGGEIQMREAGYFETAMLRLRQLRPAFVRIDHLYDYYGVYTQDEDGVPIYDWMELDRLVDAIVEAGAEPFMSISYTPPVLSNGSMTDPPDDWEAWEDLVYQTVYHFNIERGLKIQYWEVWNEPNLAGFWGGTPEELFELYGVTVRAILRADPSVKVGGMGTVSNEKFGAGMLMFTERDWVVGLTNYVMEHNLRLDFLSWHLYDAKPDNFRRNIERHQAWIKELEPTPQLILSEWNWTGGTTPKYDDGQTLAYIAAVLDVLIESPLELAFYFEPIDGTLEPEGFWGLMYRDGRPKPAFYGFQLLSELSGDLLLVNSSHPNGGAIASRDGDRIAIVVWNYESGHDPLPMMLHLSGLSMGQSVHVVVRDSALEDSVIEKQVDADGELTLILDVRDNDLKLVTFETELP